MDEQWKEASPWVSGIVTTLMGFFMKRELKRKDDDIKDLSDEIEHLNTRLDGYGTMLNGVQLDFASNGAKKSDIHLIYQEIKEMRKENQAGIERLADKIEESK